MRPQETTSQELVVPGTGELITLEDAAACARALGSIRELEEKLKEVKAELTFALTQEFRRQGLKTMEFGSIKAELRGGSGVAWDIEILEELRDLGLPEERFNDLVKAEVTYKVSATEAKRIASSNENYKEVIERARQEFIKPTYITLKGGE